MQVGRDVSVLIKTIRIKCDLRSGFSLDRFDPETDTSKSPIDPTTLCSDVMYT